VNILEGEQQEFAAICEHGHIISSALAYDASTGSDKFCEKCGARVYQKCPHCRTPVRGLLLRLDISSLDSEPEFFGEYGPYYAVNDPYVPPSYCYNCGKEFPWTAEIRKQVDAIVRRSSKILLLRNGHSSHKHGQASLVIMSILNLLPKLARY